MNTADLILKELNNCFSFSKITEIIDYTLSAHKQKLIKNDDLIYLENIIQTKYQTLIVNSN